MTKTKICGPQRIGASAMDEGDLTRAVVASYSALTQDEAREGGQAAAEQILPARRRLWALTERLLPRRLAAALRARCGTDDPTARDGVRELRRALADWLDPPPVCRWCRQVLRDGEEARKCPRRKAWKRDRCVASKSRKAAAGPVAKCGTLALYSAGQVSLEVMAAALAVPKGAAKGYDVACDRDAKALTVATSDGPPPGRDLDDPADWQDEALRRMYAAVANLAAEPIATLTGCKGPLQGLVAENLRLDGGIGEARLDLGDALGPGLVEASDGAWLGRLHAGQVGAKGSGGLGGHGIAGGVHVQHYAPLPAQCQAGMRRNLKLSHGTAIPPQIAAAREEWRRLRGEAVAANGRAVLGIQTRYYAPRDGVCRADLVQGAAIGADRGLADYDATQSRYTTYGADWMRQGCGEAWGDRDLVGTPEWVHALRVKLEDSLPGVTRADVLRAVEALADSVADDAPDAVRAKAKARAVDLARLIIPVAEVRENVLGSRPARYVRRPLFSDHSEDAIEVHAASALKAATGAAKRGKAAASDEDPERVRERVCDWLSKRLQLKKASGPGLLAALRHGAPVFVQIGSGGDEEDEATQGGTGDGGGGSERMAAVLAAPDEADSLAEEEVARMRWQAALAALSALQASGGKEAAEVVRRHHGLDSIAEDRNGATGESFASIAASGLASTGRVLTKEGVRKIYNRGIAVLQDHIAGRTSAGDLAALFADREDDADDFGPVHVPRSPWKPVGPAIVVAASLAPAAPTSPSTSRPIVDGRAWEDFRATADAAISRNPPGARPARRGRRP